MNLLIQRESGLLEAEVITWADTVDWNFSRNRREPVETVWPYPAYKFRPLLAALAFRVNISPYGGYANLLVRFEGEAEPYPGGFALCLSNTNGRYWARLYLSTARTKPEQGAT